MKKLSYLLLVMLLVGCSDEGLTERKPDYLEVYQTYQQTDLVKTCDAFEQEIKQTNHERLRIKPYKTEDNLDIAFKEKTDDGYYIYHLSCEVTGIHMLRSNEHIRETYTKPIGLYKYKDRKLSEWKQTYNEK